MFDVFSFFSEGVIVVQLFYSHLANGPWKKSSNFIFPTKYVFPQSLKF